MDRPGSQGMPVLKGIRESVAKTELVYLDLMEIKVTQDPSAYLENRELRVTLDPKGQLVGQENLDPKGPKVMQDL